MTIRSASRLRHLYCPSPEAGAAASAFRAEVLPCSRSGYRLVSRLDWYCGDCFVGGWPVLSESVTIGGAAEQTGRPPRDPVQYQADEGCTRRTQCTCSDRQFVDASGPEPRHDQRAVRDVCQHRSCGCQQQGRGVKDDGRTGTDEIPNQLRHPSGPDNLAGIRWQRPGGQHPKWEVVPPREEGIVQADIAGRERRRGRFPAAARADRQCADSEGPRRSVPRRAPSRQERWPRLVAVVVLPSPVTELVTTSDRTG